MTAKFHFASEFSRRKAAVAGALCTPPQGGDPTVIQLGAQFEDAVAHAGKEGGEANESEGVTEAPEHFIPCKELCKSSF